ncbi:MAG: sugar nucleotide-binding protein [Gammaproteobacteria bacterium]|nr:sugar nucleotide-binding protein [Gammaproteobacteria bacterium]
MSNILIIGCDGKIGSALFSHLSLHQGITVYGSTYRAVSGISKNVFYLDLAGNPQDWQIPDIPFSVVYLCAGISNMLFCEDNPELSRKVNVTAMIRLVTYFANKNTIIVYLSTNHVFSGEKPCVKDSEDYEPRNEYGRQKAEVEQSIKINCKHYVIVRLTKVLMPRSSPLSQWIEALQSYQPIEAFHDMVLAPVSLQDVIAFLDAIWQRKPTGCFQISGPEDFSYYQLGIELAILLDRPQALVTAVSALDRGIKNKFLPSFTSLDFASIISLGCKLPLPCIELIKQNLLEQDVGV